MFRRSATWDQPMCAPWLICLRHDSFRCDMTHLEPQHNRRWGLDMCNMTHSFVCAMTHLFVCAMTHLFVCAVTHSLLHMRGLDMCNMTHLFVCAMTHMFVCAMTHSFVCAVTHLLLHIRGLDMCNTTHLFVISRFCLWRDSFGCAMTQVGVPWLSWRRSATWHSFLDTGHSFVDTWHSFDMTFIRWYMRRDSLIHATRLVCAWHDSFGCDVPHLQPQRAARCRAVRSSLSRASRCAPRVRCEPRNWMSVWRHVQMHA